MQAVTSDVITVSSDEEFEPEVKKIKIISVGTLKEISAITKETPEGKPRIKNGTEESKLTIIIESKETANLNATTTDENKSFTSNSSVVILDDDVLDESVEKSDEHLNNSTADDLTNECQDLIESSKANTSTNGLLKEKNREIPDGERPSTSRASEAHILLDKFLEACANSIKGSKYETKLLTKFPKIRKYFNDCESLHNEVSLKRMLQDHTSQAQLSPPDAVVCFQRIFSYFLDNIRGASIEIPEDNLHKIKKLEVTVKRLVKKLKELEESEVNFDDEEDSTYLQTERYSKRLNEVYSKYCQLINRNPHAGRLLYEKVHFVHADHHEINRAITKAYKHNKFPTYYDIEKCVQKCVDKHNLPLSAQQIREESKKCFTKLGNLLQLRRKKELYEYHRTYMTLDEDPANNDDELKTKLQNSVEEGAKKMKDIIEKYVKLQDDNINPDVSEDSEDSNYKTTESGSEN